MTSTSFPPARRTLRAAAASLALAIGAGALTGVGSTVAAEQAHAVESTITVRAGEGWWSVAQRAGLTMHQLQVRNGMTASTVLQPGMVLKTTTTTTVVRQSTTTAKQAVVNYAVAKAKSYSTYYVWGGNGQYGFDCSGLSKAAMAAGGIWVPRTAHDQYLAAKTRVPLSQAQPGDLVFWASQSTGRVYHVAVYIGNGQIAHALNPTDDLTITSTNIMTSNRLAVVGRY